MIDNSRSLLYTLSSKSNIRAFHIAADNSLVPRITYTWPQIRSSVGVMVGETRLIQSTTSIVSISAVPSEVARRTHLIATTSTGCRLYMSAASSDYVYESANSMQVVHIRFPPMPPNQNVRDISLSQSPALTPTRKAKIIPPGYFFCIVESQDRDGDSLFISAPDTARLALLADQGHSRLQICENSSFVNLESRAEAIEVISPPLLVGNEASVQFDQAPAEVAVLTNTGVQIIKRRRLVEIFAAAIRFGASGPEAEVRKFFETYGRAEGCVTALAVACGVDTEAPDNRSGRITDKEVMELARKYFIEFGGKPRAESSYDGTTVTALESVRLSGRHEGLGLFISRVVRSIWKAPIVTEVRSPGGVATHISTIATSRLIAVQEQLQRLAKFLEDNKSFIDGLSPMTSMLGIQNKMEETAQMAEHKGLYALKELNLAMIEGISFVIVLFESHIDDVILSLPEEQRSHIKKLTYEDLFTSKTGTSLARDLVQAIVNRSIQAGGDVDSIAGSLRRRCGSFCNADDVIVFKAAELTRKAREEQDPELRQRLLQQSLIYFEQSAASLTPENVRDTALEYIYCGFYQGAVLLPLGVARQAEKSSVSGPYVVDNPQDSVSLHSVLQFMWLC